MKPIAFALALVFSGCAYLASIRPASESEQAHAERLRQARIERAESEKVWAANKKSREQEEQIQADKAAREEADQADEVEQQRATVRALVKKHGYQAVIFDVGLTDVLSAVIDGTTPLDALAHVVIEIGGFDDQFKAMQALGQGSALYMSRDSEAVLLLQNYAATVIEQSPLTALDNGYFVVKGVKRYQTANGGTKQAFVIETAWR